MSVSFAFDGDDVVWTQRFKNPAVYLDTWAIRAIAKSEELSARFVEGLRACDGTWLLTPVSTIEYSGLTDPKHAREADRLVAEAVPHVYLSDTAEMWMTHSHTEPASRTIPPADCRGMDFFSRRWAQTQSLSDTFRGMFRLIHENSGSITAPLDEVKSQVVAILVQFRQRTRNRSKVKASVPDDQRSRRQIICGELLRDFVLDPRAGITGNDAVDFMHAVDAVDYCDLILLDGAWERRVHALHDRISKAGMEMPIARCWSRRNGGIHRFLDAIEQWAQTP